MLLDITGDIVATRWKSLRDTFTKVTRHPKSKNTEIEKFVIKELAFLANTAENTTFGEKTESNNTVESDLQRSVNTEEDKYEERRCSTQNISLKELQFLANPEENTSVVQDLSRSISNQSECISECLMKSVSSEGNKDESGILDNAEYIIF